MTISTRPDQFETHLILLGCGTPNPTPERAGAAVAVVVNDTPYLIDFGPGVVRRVAAAHQKGVAALAPHLLTTAFLTHLHSDHTTGYADLILTPWVAGRAAPLRVFGPVGLKSMTEHLLAAYQADIEERLHGLEPANPNGYQVVAQEIEVGFCYRDENVQVEAFPAQHGRWPAFGFRITTSAGVIVISGDTAPHPAMVDYYAGCDILLHEVYATAGLQTRPSLWQQYHRQYHTSSIHLAKIATQVQPKQLILYHQLYWGQTEEALLDEIKEIYSGTVISGKDLDTFTLKIDD